LPLLVNKLNNLLISYIIHLIRSFDYINITDAII